MTKKPCVMAGLVIIVMGFAAVTFFTHPRATAPSRQVPLTHEEDSAGLIDTPIPMNHGAVGAKTDKRDTVDHQSIIETLRDLFDETIAHPRVQLEAIQQLIRLLKKKYPDSWQDHILEYLADTFPEYADGLIDHYKKLAAYSTWADDNRRILSEAPLYQIQDLIWEKRIEIFGDEALVIWEMELKNTEVKKVAANIQSQPERPFNEKVSYYSSQINDIYGDIAGAYIKKHQQELINTFLGIESVQEDLTSMTDAQRKEHLTDLRKSMGLDDTALQRWDDLDSERDERWNTGLAYMKAREKVLTSPGNNDPEARLDQIRKDYFGDEAEAIKREEHSGMFRFTRKRMYGKN